ncbi:MAG: sulfotransferase [Bacteroidota bacterium]|nr:sulfotransferase [Bacteroidota bacterium]MDX5505805.1 sulfotransferase [Bacteroidota bacterium]
MPGSIQETKPNTFLIGAAKSGTTTLAEYFRQHPEIYLSPIKEPHFFSSDIDPTEFSPTFRRTLPHIRPGYWESPILDPMHQSFVRSEDHYLRLFEGAAEYPIRVDASTSYLWSKEAAQNIRKFSPDAKIIVILRDPAERAYSHYLMALKYGYVKGDFEENLHRDLEASPGKWGRDELFFDLGAYGTQLDRYYSVFPKDQILVLFQSDLKSDPERFFVNVCRFLNVSIFVPDRIYSENSAAVPRFRGFTPQGFGRIREWGDRILTGRAKTLMKAIFLKDSGIPKMSPETRNELIRRYKDEIDKTQELTGRDLSSWLKT